MKQVTLRTSFFIYCLCGRWEATQPFTASNYSGLNEIDYVQICRTVPGT